MFSHTFTRVLVAALLSTGLAGSTPAHAAAPPPNRPNTFNGAPAFWIEGAAGAAWMQPGSSCWSRPAPGGGGFVGGCADTVGFSCTQQGSAPGTTGFTVRPGELLTVHGDIGGLRAEGLGFAPRDVALAPLDPRPLPQPGSSWTVRAPDAEAILSIFVRSTDAGLALSGSGDASAGLCVRPAGEPVAGEQPTPLAARLAVIGTQRAAMFLARVDAGGGAGVVLPGSVRCALRPRPTLSEHELWRCSSVVRGQFGRRAATSLARVTLAREDGVGYEHSQVPLRMIALRDAGTGSRRGLVAVRGHLVADASGVRLCAPLPSSAPIRCRRGDRLAVRGLDLASLDLVTLRGARFSDGPVVVAGRIRHGVLHAAAS